ncbi:type II secretion system protein GspD [Pseudoalteromonas xiamenensis]
MLLLQGKREEIIKALELFHLVDSPSFHDRRVALYRTVFNDAKLLVNSVKDILKQEGVKASGPEASNTAITLMPLEHIGAFLLFSQEQSLIERALYWAEQIDQPQQGTQLQYFIYNPRYSRAADLGKSLLALISGQTSLASSTSAKSENVGAKQASGNVAAKNDSMSMVVDERANSIIFHTTGTEYRSMLPLIKRLDVLPKQIMLEMLIAEVTLKDEFAMGVEFALKNGNYTAETKNALGLSEIGGLRYVLKGIDDSVNLNLFESNSLVEVLSRPSIVVRDGVAAEIKVGSKIPTVGSTTSDPDGQRPTTQVVYQNTGVELKVTPTLNAQGVIIMEIQQNISNEVKTDNPTVQGSPAIFDRAIKTEAIAETGQTIILGGLISTRHSNGDSAVPGLSQIPILGELFKTKSESNEKTELVIMVTPKVIESGDEWLHIKADLQQQLSGLKLPQGE